MDITEVLGYAAIVPIMFGAVAVFHPGISYKTGYGWSAVGTAMYIPSYVSRHDTVWTGVTVATTIWLIWMWWKSGGDDDTKRRLEQLNKKFEGTRRTAPQTA